MTYNMVECKHPVGTLVYSHVYKVNLRIVSCHMRGDLGIPGIGMWYCNAPGHGAPDVGFKGWPDAREDVPTMEHVEVSPDTWAPLYGPRRADGSW